MVVSLRCSGIPVKLCPETIKPTLPASLAGGFRELLISSYSAQRCPPGRDAHTSRTTTSPMLSSPSFATLFMCAFRSLRSRVPWISLLGRFTLLRYLCRLPVSRNSCCGVSKLFRNVPLIASVPFSEVSDGGSRERCSGARRRGWCGAVGYRPGRRAPFVVRVEARRLNSAIGLCSSGVPDAFVGNA